MIADRFSKAFVCSLLSLGSLVACGGGTEADPGHVAFDPAVTAQSDELGGVDTKSWVHVPGALVDPGCVHSVPNGSTYMDNGDVVLDGAVVAHYGACSHKPVHTRKHLAIGESSASANPNGPAPGGWVEWIQSHNTTSQDYYVSSLFTVPKAPPSPADGQLIFLFPAIEPETQNAIIQPVLQWGVTTAGGTIGSSSAWTYAAWIEYTNGQFIHSAGVQVAVNDSLKGEMGYGGSVFGQAIWGTVGSDTTNTSLATQKIFATSTGLSWTYAYAAVLETYSMNKCDDFPGGSAGANLWSSPTVNDQNGNSVNPVWSSNTPGYTGLSCNFSAGPWFAGLFALGY